MNILQQIQKDRSVKEDDYSRYKKIVQLKKMNLLQQIQKDQSVKEDESLTADTKRSFS